MLSNILKRSFGKLRPHAYPKKKPLSLDNIHQNISDPEKYYKTTDRFTKPPPGLVNICDDTAVKPMKLFSRTFMIDIRKFPDDEEVLIDVDNFKFKEYIKYLLRNKFKDLEMKDHFPYRVIQIYIIFILHIIGREILFYYYDDLKNESVTTFNVSKNSKNKQIIIADKEIDHFDFYQLERDIEYAKILFDRTFTRLK